MPVSVSAQTAVRDGLDTEDTFACVAKFPGGRLATARLTWNAGVRRVVYTLHGSRGAIQLADDTLEISAGGCVERREIPSQWSDASHAGWFGAVFDDFRAAVAAGRFAGAEAEQAAQVLALIETAYSSASAGSAERHISALRPVVAETG
jgi:hypothetical protein